MVRSVAETIAAVVARIWFVQPLFFVTATLVVTFMLKRMEFHSRTLDVLSETTK